MAKGINKVILIGNLGRDPETKYTQGGAPVCNFTLATNEEWKDRNTGEKKERTEWHRCVAFGKLAEICGQYLRKGSQVYVEGALQTRSWEQEGVTRYATEIRAFEIQILNSKGYGQKQTAPAASNPADDFDDSIPF